MANTFFQFKKFTIHQEKCSMKVCTDSCVFGAWVVNKIESEKIAPEKILDIGTGTGLLSLMIAQKSDAKIDAIEIDEAAYEQARENFESSPWSEKLTAINDDIKDVGNKKYDLIICNPPFYEHDLKSAASARNKAMHNDTLTLSQLMETIDRLLTDDGFFCVLLPYDRLQYFTEISSEDYFIKEKMLIRQTDEHNFFRVILMLQKPETDLYSNEMSIKSNGQYSQIFKELLQDYYLHL